MAQHDYNIANQSFPSFRSDLNDVLSAINTSNSGTSRPSGAVAGTIWLDTTNATNPTLKFFDGTDDISLAQLDYSANTVNWLDSTVVADLVNDLSPQLGGMLDVNGNAIGNGTEELIKFSETASAVNEVTVTNSATGNAPELSATGDDTNIDLKLTPKGTGKLVLDGLNFPTADGTTGQFLKTDGSGNLSFDDAGGGGSWVLLDTQTVSGTPSSIETGAVFSSTYDTYILVIRRMNLSSPSSIQLQIGTSGSFLASGYRWSGSGVKEGTSLVTGSSSSSVLELMGGTSSTYYSNSAQDCLSGVIWIHNPFNSGRTSIHGELSWESGADTGAHLINFAGHPATTTSYDRWKLLPSTGNFEATTIIQTFGVINA